MPDFVDEKTFEKVYSYKLDSNKLTFSNDFTASEYVDSLAASKCYSTVNVFNESGRTIISTSQKNTCIANNPMLNQITVSITLDNKVINSNATKVNGNTYIWIFNKNDGKEDRSINIIYEDIDSEEQAPSSKEQESTTMSFLDKYGLYIFLGVILLLVFIGYQAFNIMKEKNNKMDD